MTCSGKEFQIRGAATGKARLPTVDGLTDGTTKSLATGKVNDRGERPEMPRVRVRGPE